MSTGDFRHQPSPAPARQRTSTETELAGHLRDALAHLHEYIEDRAEEKAGPLVEDAAAKARQLVARNEAADAEAWAAVQSYQARLAAALGCHSSTPWPSLVAEVETRLAKESTDG